MSQRMDVQYPLDEFLPHGYICSECAEEKGGEWPEGHCATFHYNDCPYCGKRKALASVGDWNWPDRKPRGLRD